MNKASGVILIDKDRDEVLLLQRPDGSWCLPGGKTEPGETAAMGACRELAEETGYRDLSPPMLTPVRSVFNDDGFVFTCYKAVVDKFEPVLADNEHLAWGWFMLDKLPAPLFMATHTLLANTPMMAMDKSITDANGWREYKDTPISRVGVFPYLGSQTGDPSAEPDKVYMVYRPAEELQRKETIESFKLVPWIAGHTALGNVPGGKPADDVGVTGVTGEDIYFKDDTLYANLKVFGADHSEQIAKGLRELSLGYQSKFERQNGTYNGQAFDYVQREITGNHVASVEEGRMGPNVAVSDSMVFKLKGKMVMDKSVDQMTVEELLAAAKPMIAKLKELGKVAELLGGEKPAEEVEVVAKDNEGAEKPKATADNEGELKATVDNEGAEKPKTTEDSEEEVKVKTEDAAIRVMKMIGERDSLARSLAPIVGVFDHSNMTRSEVAKYGCKKLNINVEAGGEVHALRGYLAAHAVTAQRAAPVTMDGGLATPSTTPAFLANHV